MNNMYRESMRDKSWNDKTMRQKATALGITMGVFLACAIAAYALVQLWGSQSLTISNTKGHVFEFELTGTPDMEVVPGSEQMLSPTVFNKSTTDNIYCFIGFDYDENLYEIIEVDGWELLENQGGHLVYSYSTDGTMNEVEMGNNAAFSGKLKCIATGATFQTTAESDFAVDITGYAISTDICGVSKNEAWQDYISASNSN